MHDNLISADSESITDSGGQILEDLITTIVRGDPGIVELPFETNLPKERVGRR